MPLLTERRLSISQNFPSRWTTECLAPFTQELSAEIEISAKLPNSLELINWKIILKINTVETEKKIFLAKVAEQPKHFDGMVNFIDELIKANSDFNKKFNLQ